METRGVGTVIGPWRHLEAVPGRWQRSKRTDLPAVLMAFPDFKFPEGESFMHHTTVLKYLEDYACHFSLLTSIKFGHRVEEVSPAAAHDGQMSWRVTVRDLSTDLTHVTTCWALFICNGHFSEPNFPEIEGIEKYRGQRLHSHDYREPSAFLDRRVMVLGAGASGLDIGLEIAKVADKVFLSHKFPIVIPSEFPNTLRQVRAVVTANETGFVLTDGTHVEADVILYCTGYKYKFPFLTGECGIEVKDNLVHNLHKHIINIRYPTMGFIGLPSRVIVFPLVNYQVQYFLATLRGEVTLPSLEEMTAIAHKTNHERREQGLSDKHYHTLSSDQFEYLEDLAREAGLKQPPLFMPQLLRIVLLRLFFSFPVFKSYSYDISGDGVIIETLRGRRIATHWDLFKLILTQFVRCLWRDFPRVVGFFVSHLMSKFTGFFRVSK
ncbi:flavin-containing monooxygenase FMO GS-OX-like 4 isoform X2 [Portunus trituberculatus]|uniref:flavin-containing monooxygenase FMO GS-OX-like 4 isoform X2 n=1 Tax=Portunus trituberculatus TaxID=210409 RepID=UPI001E1CDC5C|nr:flavin-containing monooxygenase FMO GS-OX-like 4 isoform X2 [Portunus trituberculatus]